MDEDGAVGSVMGPDAGLSGEVEGPEDVGVRHGRGDGDWQGVGAAKVEVGGFVLKWALVAVGLSADVQALDDAAIVDEVDAVAFDGDGRGHAGLGPVVVDILFALGDGQLPFESSGGFGEAEQDAAIAGTAGVAGEFIVGADEDAPVGDHGGGVRFGSRGTQRDAPPDVGSVGRIECGREVDLG